MAKSIHTRQYKAFKRLLKQTRAEKNITQTELAEKLGVPQSRISKIELGERRIDIVELRAWCEALGITLERFVIRLEQLPQFGTDR